MSTRPWIERTLTILFTVAIKSGVLASASGVNSFSTSTFLWARLHDDTSSKITKGAASTANLSFSDRLRRVRLCINESIMPALGGRLCAYDSLARSHANKASSPLSTRVNSEKEKAARSVHAALIFKNKFDRKR